MAATANAPVGLRQAAHYEPLALLTAALAGGIFLDRYYPQSITHWWLAAASCLTAWLLPFVLRWDRIASLFSLLAVAATGAAWHHACWHLVDADHVVTQIREESQPICLEAYVLS